MAYQMIYEKTMDSEEARKLLMGHSELTTLKQHNPLNFSDGENWHNGVVHVEGTDGNVYTGTAYRNAEEGKTLNEGNNKVSLLFAFGEKQPRKPLEDRVGEFGFVRREVTSPNPNLVYVPEINRFLSKSLAEKYYAER